MYETLDEAKDICQSNGRLLCLPTPMGKGHKVYVCILDIKKKENAFKPLFLH